MDTIRNYLDNMFMNLPKSREIQKAKDELYAMMEDKYNELKREGKTENEAIGIVISEFGNLDELAGELGINLSAQYEQEQLAGTIVTMEEATAYMEDSKKAALGIAGGVMLCICCAIPLLLLLAWQEAGLGLGENAAVVFGVSILLLMITVAVGLFIVIGYRMEKYEYLKKERLTLDESVKGYVEGLYTSRRNSIMLRIVAGVAMCILAVLPVLVLGVLAEGDPVMEILPVCGLLFVIGLAVFLFVTAGMEDENYKVLLQKKEFLPSNKENKLVGVVASIYWPITVCIFLGYSFLTMDWGRSWIIWPVAGVLFGAVASICNAIESRDNQH